MSKKSKKTNLKINYFVWIVAIVVLILVLSSSIVYVDAVSDRLSTKIVYPLNNVFAQIPAIPRTPKQILIRTFEVNKNLKSYTLDSKLSLTNDDVGLIEINTQASLSGPATETSLSKSHVKGKTTYPIQAEFDFETVNVGEKTFFKINKGVKVGELDVTNLKGWQQINLNKLQKSLKINIRSEEGIVSDINKELENQLADQFEQKSLKFKETSKDGKAYYQIEATLEKNPITATFFQDQASVETRVTLLIEKNNYYLRRVLLESHDKLQTRLIFDNLIDKHNQSLEITRPDSSQEVKNPIDLYILLTSNSDFSQDSLLKALSANRSEVLTSFLTIERLVKVLLLLPKSF